MGAERQNLTEYVLAFSAKQPIIQGMGQEARPVFLVKRIPWKWGLLLTALLLVVGWLLDTPAGLLGKADAIGYAVCHRIDLRSFHLDGRQAPLCARCTGMYLGIFVAMLYLAILGPRRGELPVMKLWPILGLLVAAFAVDGINSYFHLSVLMKALPGLPRLYEPNNTLRLFTGTGMGIAIAAVLYPTFNQTVWSNWKPEPALRSFRALGGLLILAGIVDGLALSENIVLLYPLALISSATVLVILTMVYCMFLLMATRRDNLILQPRQLFWPLLAGFIIALAQIAVFDFVRLQLMGSWAGFPLS